MFGLPAAAALLPSALMLSPSLGIPFVLPMHRLAPTVFALPSPFLPPLRNPAAAPRFQPPPLPPSPCVCGCLLTTASSQTRPSLHIALLQLPAPPAQFRRCGRGPCGSRLASAHAAGRFPPALLCPALVLGRPLTFLLVSHAQSAFPIIGTSRAGVRLIRRGDAQCPVPCQAGLRFLDLTTLAVLTRTDGAHWHVTQIYSAVEFLVG